MFFFKVLILKFKETAAAPSRFFEIKKVSYEFSKQICLYCRCFGNLNPRTIIAVMSLLKHRK